MTVEHNTTTSIPYMPPAAIIQLNYVMCSIVSTSGKLV